jgi:hypothetical protein
MGGKKLSRTTSIWLGVAVVIVGLVIGWIISPWSSSQKANPQAVCSLSAEAFGKVAQYLNGDPDLNSVLAFVTQTPGVQQACESAVRQMVDDPTTPVLINGGTTTGNQVKNQWP